MKKKKRKKILDIPSDEIYPWLRKFSFHFRAPISATISGTWTMSLLIFSSVLQLLMSSSSRRQMSK